MVQIPSFEVTWRRASARAWLVMTVVLLFAVVAYLTMCLFTSDRIVFSLFVVALLVHLISAQRTWFEYTRRMREIKHLEG